METLPFRDACRRATSFGPIETTISLVTDFPADLRPGLLPSCVEEGYNSRDCQEGLMLVDPLVDPLDPESTFGVKIFFEAGARTRWHRKSARSLILISGQGLIQRGGGALESIPAGTVLKIPSGEKIWFGAAPSHSATYIVLQDGEV